MPSADSFFAKLAAGIGRVFSKIAPEAPQEDENPCCSGTVQIAFRGIADDRMYISRGRKWAEVKFFKQNGLRVFCADCRRRLL